MCSTAARYLITYYANVGKEDAASIRRVQRARRMIYAHRETCEACKREYLTRSNFNAGNGKSWEKRPARQEAKP